MEYQSLSKSKAKELKGLSSKKDRDHKRLFLAEGEKCVFDMLPAFTLRALIVTRDWLVRNEFLAQNFSDKILVADHRTLEIISSLNSLPDVIAVFEMPKIAGYIPKLNKENLYVLLDEIQDPGNMGTIIRTCDWFGVYEIYASKTTVDAFSPKVVQSSMGSLSRVKVVYTDLKDLILKNRDLRVIGTLLEGCPLKDCSLSPEGLLLLGNEGRGISQELRELIDSPVLIPPVNPESHPDSLNVAIANAVMLSHLRGNSYHL